ncbi:MAG: hypothetical protein IPG35_06650 [Flavobacteriales bacterium]|nr:hypothetical protein [Flavobacteriales bacterium]MBK9698935.1 hypothetical protein [Flavobacteriales bacterium]
MKRFWIVMIVLVPALLETTTSKGQAFMRRYDVLGQNRAQGAVGIEPLADSTWLVVLSGKLQVGSLIYSSVVTALRINADGEPLDTAVAFLDGYSTYPGWVNTGCPRHGGGVVVGGGDKDTANIDRAVLYFFRPTGVFDSLLAYGSVGDERIGRQAKATLDGGYVIVGETSSSGTSLDGFLLKVDSLGSQEWVQTYGLANRTEYLTTVDLAPANGYYLGGQLNAGGGNYDQWLLRVDSSGQEVWQETYGTVYNDFPNAHVTSLADGTVVFATSFTLNVAEDQVLALVKVDPDGTTLWNKTYDGAQFDNALFAVKEVNPGGDLIAVGQSSLPSLFNGVLLRTTAQGDSLWLRYYQYADSVWTQGFGTLRDVVPTADGGFIAVGTAYPASNNPNDPPIYGQDTWVVKVDSMGCLEPGCHLITGLTSQVTNLRGALRVWPNPVQAQGQGQVQVAWDLPEAVTGSAQLTLVSAAGQVMGSWPVALAEQGHTLDLGGTSPGLYHVHLVVEGRWVSGAKVVVE